MRVTIGIPCYRDFDLLKHLLSCIDKQIFVFKKDVEVIVVNDDIKQKIYGDEFVFSKFYLKILNIEHAGVASARNKIIELAQGEIILFLDSDTCPSVDWLQRMVDFFNKHKEASAVGGHVRPIQTNKGLVNEYYNVTNRLERPIIDKKTGEIVTIITVNCGFRTKILKQIGGFDKKNFYLCSPGGEDMDLSFRLRQAGYKLYYEPKAIVFHKYPTNFTSIFSKYTNYGKGIKIYCLSRKINPKDIRQPGFDFFSFIIYNLKVFYKFIKYLNYFKNKKVGMLKCLFFSFFDIVMYVAHGYGFYFKK